MIFEHEEIVGPTEQPLDPTLKGSAYRTLRCAGCNTIYFQLERLAVSADDLCEDPFEPSFADLKGYIIQCRDVNPGTIVVDEISCWPAPYAKSERPDWSGLSDATLVHLLRSVYRALDYDLPVLSAVGMRIVFDRAAELVGVDPSKSFARKLDQLKADGHISAAERDGLAGC